MKKPEMCLPKLIFIVFFANSLNSNRNSLHMRVARIQQMSLFRINYTRLVIHARAYILCTAYVNNERVHLKA